MSLSKPAKYPCGTISQIKQAFKDLLKVCGRKNELPHNFEFDEHLKRSLVNESYYIRINDVTALNRDGLCLELSTNVEICLYYQCGKLEVETQERALLEGEGFLVHVLDFKNLPGCFQYINFNRMFTEPATANNCYIVKVCLDFDVRQTIRLDAIVN